MLIKTKITWKHLFFIIHDSIYPLFFLYIRPLVPHCEHTFVFRFVCVLFVRHRMTCLTHTHAQPIPVVRQHYRQISLVGRWRLGVHDPVRRAHFAASAGSAVRLGFQTSPTTTRTTMAMMEVWTKHPGCTITTNRTIFSSSPLFYQRSFSIFLFYRTISTQFHFFYYFIY